MTLDEQYQFMMERPTPKTPAEIRSYEGHPWIEYILPDPCLGRVNRQNIRWKPEPKTVPAWPPVKPYWVRSIGNKRIESVDAYDEDGIVILECYHDLSDMIDREWTTDFKTFHPFTKEIEE